MFVGRTILLDYSMLESSITLSDCDTDAVEDNREWDRSHCEPEESRVEKIRRRQREGQEGDDSLR